MILSILVALIIFCLVIWVIGLLPMPAIPFPIKTVLYIVAALLFILWLVKFLR